MKRSEVDKSKLSPMMLKYLEVKEKYNDTIVFYRLGDFYEMFFEDAIIASRELELTLTGRNAGLDERVPMCGIPYHAYLSYLEKLVEKGYKVAICEQLTDPKLSKGLVDRDVIQVVTKGTIIDDTLEAKDNNYIGAVFDFDYCYGVSYCDISTGEFHSMILNYNNDELITDLLNHNVRELLMNSKVDKGVYSTLKDTYHILITIRDDIYDGEEYKYITKELNDIRLVTVSNFLLKYILDNKKGDMSHLQKVHLIETNKYLQFDNHTKRNLELVETLRQKERMYSLLWLLDKTKTAMGSRLLKYNIENPLVEKDEINKRFDVVDKLLTEFILKNDLQTYLDDVYDLERLCSRISYGNMNARDLLQLKKSLKVLPNIREILKEIEFYMDIDTFDDIYDLLEKSINEDPPIGIHDGGIIKQGYNSELDELRSVSINSKDFILKIEQEEKEKTGIKNLHLGYNKVFGYYIEISKSNIPLVKDEWGWDRKQTLANAERFITPLLKEKESIILGAEEKIMSLEYELFMEIRDRIKKYTSSIQKTSKVIALIDMLCSFATVSEENAFVRPIFTDENIVDIKDARHPVVEKVSKEEFVPNDIIMGKDTDILLITGPNMAGKSTYMRTFAIIVIMAQIGCFVPCKSAKIKIFDKIFTRIGASDDLVSGDSTFMVEMKEANNAITNATENSLLIFDELGRGTATYDGMALARSILEYIHNKVKTKTLFSTHYHELTSLSSELKRLSNVHVSAVEEEGKITFLHKVKQGAVDKSYGIHVASLAHLPKDVIDRAYEILDTYENKKKDKSKPKQLELLIEEEQTDDTDNKVIEELKKLNPLEITPMDAINILYKLSNEAKENSHK